MQAPKFETYYPSESGMSPDQRSFYRYLVEEIKQGRYPRVQGNISYLFVHVYNILPKWNQRGYEYVYSELLDLAEAYYQEEKFASYCRRWSYDCLLSLEKYEEFLSLTEPENIFSADTHFSNLRCNVYYHLGKSAKAVDLLKMFGCRVTKYTEKHATPFRDFLEVAFAKMAEKEGPWLNRLLAAQRPVETYGCSLFSGSPVGQSQPRFPYYCFYASYDVSDVIQSVVRIAENNLREAHQIPKVGEGWISETALFYAIKKAFPQTQVVQHGSPEWLGRQHFDIWMPRWRIAIEYHGKQHFEPVEIFGGVEGFEATRERDFRKKKLCKANKVDLIVVTSQVSHEEVVRKIEQVRLSTIKAA